MFLCRTVLHPSAQSCRRRTIISTFRAFCDTAEKSPTSKFTNRTHNCGELTEAHVGARVSLSGWLQFRRLNFATIRDGYGATQVVLPKELVALLSKTPPESVVRVNGMVRPRPYSHQNNSLMTGDIEIAAESFEVLNYSKKAVPFLPREFQEKKETLRLKYRYIDLRHDKMQHNLRMRSRIAQAFRKHLIDELGFCEIETPTLFRRTPGGAKEFPVASSSFPGHFYSLTQSPQQFKQLLMVGNLDRYFQIARCYRDETGRPDRQPEFTQIDLEMSFTSASQIRDLLEEMVKKVWPSALPDEKFPVITYEEAMSLYGTDKPDLRFDLFIEDGSFLVPSVLKDLPEGHVVRCIRFQDDGGRIGKPDIKVWNKYTKGQTSLTGLKEVLRSGNTFRSPLKEIFDSKALEGSTHSYILLWGERRSVETVLGKIRLELAERLMIVPKKEFAFLWVVDFPLFSLNDKGELKSEHHPFTAAHEEDLEYLPSEPLKCRGQHFDLVLNGSEIGGGSVRIHSAEMQRMILKDILKEDTSSLAHLLEALECGAPPHGGFAFGFDRLMAMICRATSIRDVIAFPKTSEGRDLLSDAPAKLSDEDQRYFHLSKDPKIEEEVVTEERKIEE